MKEYVKPVVLENEELSEGIYAASGCWTANGAGRQVAVSARGDFRFQINGHHINEAHLAKVYITFTFDKMIKSAEFCGYSLVNGDISGGVTVVTFELTNFGGGVNPNESFGGGALNVRTLDESQKELELLSVVMTDGGCR